MKKIEIKKDFFFYFLFISFLIHGSLALFFIIGHFFFPKKLIVYEKAVRIDIVGLPEKNDSLPSHSSSPIPSKSIKEERKSQLIEKKTKVETKKEIVKTNETLQTKTKKQTANRGVEKLKQLSALEQLEKSIQEEELKNLQASVQSRKGNQISDGRSLSGIAKLEADNYIGSVESHIKSYWKLPQWLLNKNLSARALVKWDKNGNPTLIQIIQNSGDDQFDELVMKTIQDAMPFPAPPEEFVFLMRNEGIVFGFPE